MPETEATYENAPATFDEAVALLRSAPLGVRRQFYALRRGYVGQEALEHGLGLYSVEVATGNVCEFTGRWTVEGDLLLCETCFEDGT